MTKADIMLSVINDGIAEGFDSPINSSQYICEGERTRSRYISTLWLLKLVRSQAKHINILTFDFGNTYTYLYYYFIYLLLFIHFIKEIKIIINLKGCQISAQSGAGKWAKFTITCNILIKYAFICIERV